MPRLLCPCCLQSMSNELCLQEHSGPRNGTLGWHHLPAPSYCHHQEAGHPTFSSWRVQMRLGVEHSTKVRWKDEREGQTPQKVARAKGIPQIPARWSIRPALGRDTHIGQPAVPRTLLVLYGTKSPLCSLRAEHPVFLIFPNTLRARTVKTARQNGPVGTMLGTRADTQTISVLDGRQGYLVRHARLLFGCWALRAACQGTLF